MSVRSRLESHVRARCQPSDAKLFIVGLTGGIGSGKSTVCSLLAQKGAEIIDADQLARDAVEPGTQANQSIRERFGIQALSPDGTLDRQKVASIVFHDPSALADLNAITHPAVAKLMATKLGAIAGREAESDDNTIVVLDIPLLTQATRQKYPMQVVIVVDCPDEVRLSRLVTQRKMDVLDARARMASQIGRTDRLKLADFVVENGSSRGELDEEVDRLWKWLLEASTDQSDSSSS